VITALVEYVGNQHANVHITDGWSCRLRETLAIGCAGLTQ